MKTIDETTLIAYVDGELDAKTAADVEAHLETDSEARAYVERLREISALAGVAFNDILHETPPEHLIATATTEPTQLAAKNRGQHGGAVVNLAGRNAKTGNWRAALPMAAALAGLMIGGGGGYGISEQRTESALRIAMLTQQVEQTEIEKTLGRALEVNLSGTPLTWTNPDGNRRAEITPVRTYQDKAGRFCREYRKDVTTDGLMDSTVGLACRNDGGQWKTRYLIIEPGTQSL